MNEVDQVLLVHLYFLLVFSQY